VRPDRILITGLCATLLAACTTLPATRDTTATALPTREVLEAAQVNSLLGDLMRVAAGTPTEQAEVMARARHDYEQERQGAALLRYALLLAAPVHPARNPTEAQRLLRESLARPEQLSSMERALAHVELERINEELRQTDEYQRLLAENEQARERQRNEPNGAAITRQLQAAQAENAQLREQLRDARAKLDAIADFERRQNDRPSASEGRNP
jgi:hypothetical protein